MTAFSVEARPILSTHLSTSEPTTPQECPSTAPPTVCPSDVVQRLVSGRGREPSIQSERAMVVRFVRSNRTDKPGERFIASGLNKQWHHTSHTDHDFCLPVDQAARPGARNRGGLHPCYCADASFGGQIVTRLSAQQPPFPARHECVNKCVYSRAYHAKRMSLKCDLRADMKSTGGSSRRPIALVAHLG